MKETDLGQVDMEEEVAKRKSPLYIPNWFSVEIKTGVRSYYSNTVDRTHGNSMYATALFENLL